MHGVEARNLGVTGMVTGLSSSVDECGDRVVAAATGGVGGARVQAATGSLDPTHPKRRWSESIVLLGLEHGSVVKVEPPQPGVNLPDVTSRL